jgi:hypothetical protein
LGRAEFRPSGSGHSSLRRSSRRRKIRGRRRRRKSRKRRRRRRRNGDRDATRHSYVCTLHENVHNGSTHSSLL